MLFPRQDRLRCPEGRAGGSTGTVNLKDIFQRGGGTTLSQPVQMTRPRSRVSGWTQ